MELQLLTTPSFQNDSWQVPKNTQKKLTHALKQIQSDPYTGRGNAKKCFKHQYNNVYRYRIGDYRLIYCVGNKFVKLLMAGKRANIYQRFTSGSNDNLDVPEKADDLEPVPIHTTHFDPPKIIPPSPEEDQKQVAAYDSEESTRLLEELLKEWGVEDRSIGLISNCSCIDDILDLEIDDDVKERVLRWKQPSKIEEIVEEPVYELPSAEHLEKYMAGTLQGFLLKLDPEQEKVAKKNLKGPTLVKGGPGTGKSLVALYRIRNLLQPESQKSLFNELPPKTLFVTYTTTLIRASEQLLKPLLGDLMKHVDVTNIDKIVRKLIGQAGLKFKPAEVDHKKDDLREAIDLFLKEEGEKPIIIRFLQKVSLDYLLAEFDWVIEGREIKSLDDYLREDRSGRGIPFDKKTRKITWNIYEHYRNKLLKNERQTWDQLRSKALEVLLNGEVSMPKYDVVIIDEAQDLTPVGIKLCMALCETPQGFYMTADSGQSIYNRGFSWKRIDSAINVQGRTTILKYNYRSTRQIMEAAMQPLKDNGGSDPETVDLIPIIDGPKPKLIGCGNVEEQLQQTADFLKRSSREIRLPISAGAVLVRGNKAGKVFAEGLSNLGIPAEVVRGSTFNMGKNIVKVMTFHSAKGLEFPFVAVVRVDGNQIPAVWGIKDPEEKNARLIDERRLLSVGLSRAMRRLALVYDRNRPSRFIGEIKRGLWNVKP